MSAAKYFIPVVIATVLGGLFALHKVAPPYARIANHFVLDGTGFAAGQVYPTAVDSYSADPLAFYGSWLGSDESVGSVVSPWLPIRKRFSMMVTGYPQTQGNLLAVEVMDLDGRIARVSHDFQNAGETWTLETIALEPSERASQFRIVAEDQSSAFQGWLGFSEPFVAPEDSTRQIADLLALGLTAVAAFLLYYLPGLLCRALLRRAGWEFPFAAVPAVGIALMATMGLALWLFSHAIRSQILVYWIITPLFVGLAWLSWGRELGALADSMERRVLFVLALVMIVATAKATYSLGPVGELYAGTVSRTLEVGDRSDSRVSFHNVQLVANGLRPEDPLAQSYFSPWYFSSRGPIAGLAAVPLVLASEASVPRGMPDQPWRPFDPQGFAVYRIAMMAMATTAFLVFYALVSKVISPRWGYFALLLAATSPFLLHEVYFTWPKMESAAFVMLATFWILDRRFLLGGLSLGFAYVCHPLALLSIPAIGGILLMIHVPSLKKMGEVQAWWKLLASAVPFCVGLGVWVVAWRLVNWHSFEQGAFLNYFLVPPGWAWWTLRFNSILSTLMPLWLFFVNSGSFAVNAVGKPSPSVVHFFFQYWNTVPFGLGIVFFPFLLVWSRRFLRRHAFQCLALILIPFFCFAIFWGVTPTGLLREGMHVWVFAVLYGVVVACMAWIPSQDSGLLRAMEIALALRGVELLAMLLVPTVFTQRAILSSHYHLNDAVAIAGMASGVVLLCWQTFQAARSTFCEPRIVQPR